MSTQGDFFNNLREAVRDNPIAAALIGGGAAWLLFGDELKSAGRSVTTAASPNVQRGSHRLHAQQHRDGFDDFAAPPTAPAGNHEGSLGVGETLQDAGRAASNVMAGASGKVRDQFDESVAYARENFGKLATQISGKEVLTKTQSMLTDVFERQPLILGAIGLAIGAAVAGGFRTSNFESEWIGEFSDGVKDNLNARVGTVSRNLSEASDILKAELSDTGTEALDRIKQT